MGALMKLVVIESPYAGDTEKNLRYLRACLRHSLMRGEAPFASHGLYTQPGVLDDNVPEERNLGISSGLEWASQAFVCAVYTDMGISAGMELGISQARLNGMLVEHRSLGWVDPGPQLSEHDKFAAEIAVDLMAERRAIEEERRVLAVRRRIGRAVAKELADELTHEQERLRDMADELERVKYDRDCLRDEVAPLWAEIGRLRAGISALSGQSAEVSR